MPVRTDIGQYGIIPLWLLNTGVSSRAIHLYSILVCKYADKTGQSYPTRKTLATDLGGVHEISVDRAVKELEGVGALKVTRKRKTEAGDYSSNLYHITLVRSGGNTEVTTGGDMRVTTGGNTGVEQTISNSNHPHKEPTETGDSATALSPVSNGMVALTKVRGYQSTRYAAEAKAMKDLFRLGYSSEDIIGCWRWMKTRDFWADKALHLMSVVGEIGQWAASGKPTEAQVRFPTRTKVSPPTPPQPEMKPGVQPSWRTLLDPSDPMYISEQDVKDYEAGLTPTLRRRTPQATRGG